VDPLPSVTDFFRRTSTAIPQSPYVFLVTQKASTMTDPSSVLKQGDVLRLEVSPQYATIRVIPNGSEAQNANFPKNLHNAAELFLKLGMVPQAVKLKECVDALLQRFASNPDGKSGVRLGKGCVCWQCGFCGIPKDYVEGQPAAGGCANCSAVDQLNWVAVSPEEKGSDDLPWIEEAAMSEAQAKELKAKKEKELAEKRAAVEARVAEAMAEREKQEATEKNKSL